MSENVSNVIHLGKKSRKEIKKFKKGYGKMFMEVQQVNESAKTTVFVGLYVLPKVGHFRKKVKTGAVPGATHVQKINI